MHVLIVQQPYLEENCECSKYSSHEKVMSCRYFLMWESMFIRKNSTYIFTSFSWDDIMTIGVDVVYITGNTVTWNTEHNNYSFISIDTTRINS